MTRIIAIILALAFAGPAVAQDCPANDTLANIAQTITDHDGDIIALIDVPGSGFDQLLVASYLGAVAVGAFKDGCAVTGPIPVGPVDDKPKVGA